MKTVPVALALAAFLSPAAAHSQSAPAAPPRAATAATARTPLTRAATVLVPDSLNVFRRFTADGPKTLAFYGDVLGLKTLQPVGQVYRFQVGTSERSEERRVGEEGGARWSGERYEEREWHGD